jgi:hypothetical protein
MKWVRTVFFSVFALALTQLAWGQNHDPFVQDRVDPAKSVKLYPNPSTEYLNIKFEAPQAKTAKVAVHNIIGNLLDVESEIVDEYEIRLKVKDLPAGVYLLSVKDDGNGQASFKFLKR